MIKDEVQKIIEHHNLNKTDHTLIFRFFERKDDNDIVITSIEIAHLGKRFRFINSSITLQKIFNIKSKHIRLSLDAKDNLYEFFTSKKYYYTKTLYEVNTWADDIIEYSKIIDINKIDVELERFFTFYYNLCLDYNVPLDSIPLDSIIDD